MGLTGDWLGRTELTCAIPSKNTTLALELPEQGAGLKRSEVQATPRQNAKDLVPGPIADYMKTYPKRNAPEEGV